MKFIHRFQTLLRNDRGLSTVEYVIILAIIAVGGISFWNGFGDKVTQKIENSGTSVSTAGDGLRKPQ